MICRDKTLDRRLFVATSYHHLLTAIAIKLLYKCEMDLFISNMSSGNEYWEKYLAKIRENKWFGNIWLFDERKMHPPKPYHVFKTYNYELRLEKRIINNISGFDIHRYKLVYLVDDKMFLGSTIVRDKIKYHLVEDTAYIYRIMKESGQSKVMRLPYQVIYRILDLLNYWHPVFGYGDACVGIETSTLENIINLPKDKLILTDRKEMINSIPQKEKDKVINMFMGEDKLKKIGNGNGFVILLTSPLKRGDTNTEQQIKALKYAMKDYNERRIVIKPHPRDDTDYKEIMPSVIVLNKDFPCDILNYIDGLMFDEVVSLGSTAIGTIDFAKKIRMYPYKMLASL